MQLRWFKGQRLGDVMREVRAAFGPDAVIMHTRTERAPGVRGVFGRPTVAVLAAIDEDGEAPAPARVDDAPPPAPVAVGAVAPRAAGHARGRAPAAAPAAGTPASGIGAPRMTDALRLEIAELRRLLLRVDGARALRGELGPFWERLTSAGVDEALAFRVLEEVPATAVTGPSIERAVEAALVAALGVPAAPPAAEATRVFVGPPGSGKTAMVSKLAVRARLDGVAAHIVSLDGTSLGGRAQLEALTAHAGVPHALALSIAAVREALAAVPAGTLTLLDTPGLSPRDGEGIGALVALLDAAGPAEVHLVLPATAKPADALAAAAALAPLGPRRLVFTRLDETTSTGTLVSVTASLGLALAYFGTGRDIPHDMEPATSRSLARRVLRGDASA